ncbi:MAG TPA: hypothetical protein VMV86_03445 [Methanosarcinales archaeon]|nr:hypothetical protein [Methanosarcinales archaeon]
MKYVEYKGVRVYLDPSIGSNEVMMPSNIKQRIKLLSNDYVGRPQTKGLVCSGQEVIKVNDNTSYFSVQVIVNTWFSTGVKHGK